jgi:hypothetical protein
MLTIVYEIVLIYFIGLFIWNIIETKDVFKQMAIVVIIIPFALRVLHIR